MPIIMIVPPEMPVSCADGIRRLRASPAEATQFRLVGIGSTAFIGAELFRQTAKLEMTHVPYRGSPEAQTAVIRNDAQTSSRSGMLAPI